MGDLNETAATSLLYAGNAPFLEALYEEYLGDPAAVPAAWKAYFDALSASGGGSAGQDSRHREILEDYRQMARRRGRLSGRSGEPGLGPEAAQKQGAVLRLIRAYRLLGHLRARVDSIGLSEPPAVPDLDPAFHGLDAADLDRVFNTGTLLAPREARLRDILRVLDETYLGPIGVEYIHISDVAQRQWIEHRFESCRSRPAFSAEEKRDILLQLTAAEGLERYLHTKYAGQKRFSLEGGESLIPLLNELTARAAGHSVKEIAIGMAHRGRLNVLINIMGKLPADLFQDFEGKEIFGDVDVTSGDVKYHQGFSADALTPHGPVHLALAFNPSHLEIINPVVEGSVRARQERRGDDARGQVIAILVHGDASIAGQGVVYETLNLAQTRGFTTGGTVHIVVNNRIGFTLSHPMDVRSTLYCTDIAKVVQAPVFHVDGDDPEAVIFAARTALDFRMAFHKDVMIDLV
ncbi:MAG: 2-oxoglutarate dehydrogenase E1 component, partial [Planctomycetes bacterium]|nr:2-oxoglutarate dehydrogenase E1 component [Planctomycetota bacterium]